MAQDAAASLSTLLPAYEDALARVYDSNHRAYEESVRLDTGGIVTGLDTAAGRPAKTSPMGSRSWIWCWTLAAS